jgi:hypothetical protein
VKHLKRFDFDGTNFTKNFCERKVAGVSERRIFNVDSESIVAMKAKKQKIVEQPKPFTPGITRAMVRQHAYALFRDKLPNHPLTLEDWVLAEKDLVNDRDAEEVEA